MSANQESDQILKVNEIAVNQFNSGDAELPNITPSLLSSSARFKQIERSSRNDQIYTACLATAASVFMSLFFFGAIAVVLDGVSLYLIGKSLNAEKQPTPPVQGLGACVALWNACRLFMQLVGCIPVT